MINTNEEQPNPLVDMMIDEVIERFDFEKVRHIILRLGWVWPGEDFIPEVNDMKYLARNMVVDLVERIKEQRMIHVQDLDMTSGWLYAVAHRDRGTTDVKWVELKFVLEESSAANYEVSN
tara:strand:- start:235 stop:594 length:360 start_codon:yes stop_codon:yes gene_type:complete